MLVQGAYINEQHVNRRAHNSSLRTTAPPIQLSAVQQTV